MLARYSLFLRTNVASIESLPQGLFLCPPHLESLIPSLRTCLLALPQRLTPPLPPKHHPCVKAFPSLCSELNVLSPSQLLQWRTLLFPLISCVFLPTSGIPLRHAGSSQRSLRPRRRIFLLTHPLRKIPFSLTAAFCSTRGIVFLFRHDSPALLSLRGVH